MNDDSFADAYATFHPQIEESGAFSGLDGGGRTVIAVKDAG